MPLLSRRPTHRSFPAARRKARLAALSALLAAAASVGAEDYGVGSPSDASTAWEKKLESVLAKEGITVGGVFRSQYLHASIGGPAAVEALRTEETVEFTSVDFDIRARPNTLTQGRAVFRMHQDWRNFFSDISNPIFTRWLSIDGEAGGMFSYHAGDFRARYTPLTLFAPQIDLLYEPEAFARSRKTAMDEFFLGGNDRLLQGVNLAFDAEIVDVLQELHLDAIGSRLRNVETRVENGNKVTASVERSLTEKFAVGGHAATRFLHGARLGATFLSIFDKNGTYAGTGDADTAVQSTRILGANGGADLHKLLSQSEGEDAPWTLSFDFEAAQSSDDSAFFAAATDEEATVETLDALAFTAGLSAGYDAGAAGRFGLGFTYLKTEPGYRNELAQSPTFLGERILNIDNDSSRIKQNNPTAPHYTTFDALYRTVFKFAPAEGTNSWQKAPFNKNSYRNAIMTQGEMAAAASRLDPALQLVWPFGAATPNRQGLKARLTYQALGGSLEAQALYAGVSEVEGMALDSARALPATDFTEMGGGLRFEIGRWLGWTYPLSATLSHVASTAKQDGLAGDSLAIATEWNTGITQAGLKAGFYKRASVLAGFQQIATTATVGGSEAETVQRQIGGGLEYRLGAGAYADAMITRVSSDRPGEDDDFGQWLTEVSMRVGF